VTHERFIPTEDSPRRSYGGDLFYFANSRTASTFDGDQVKYGDPTPGMREKPATN
jgi:hypothetical protein